jgi:hypothetical protein
MLTLAELKVSFAIKERLGLYILFKNVSRKILIIRLLSELSYLLIVFHWQQNLDIGTKRK